MPYIVNRPYASPNDVQSIADGLINTTYYSVGIQGRNAINYGETYAKAIVNLTQNFANANAPVNPIPGQCWYDFTNQILKLNTGTSDGAVNATWSRIVTAAGANSDEIGSPTTPMNKIYANDFYGGIFHGSLDGVALQARYADLAERYEADAHYSVGTVLMLGGTKEVTQTTSHATVELFGIVSESPGLLLNAKAGKDDTHPCVALAGRVKVRVIGKTNKSQRLVASDVPGVAIAVPAEQLSTCNVLSIIGRALENKDTEEEGLVLVAVGAK